MSNIDPRCGSWATPPEPFKPEDFEEDLEIMRKLKAGEITEDELMDQVYGEGSSEYFHKIMEEGWELEDEE